MPTSGPGNFPEAAVVVSLGVATGDPLALAALPGCAHGIGVAVAEPVVSAETSGPAYGLGVAVGGGACLATVGGVAVGLSVDVGDVRAAQAAVLVGMGIAVGDSLTTNQATGTVDGIGVAIGDPSAIANASGPAIGYDVTVGVATVEVTTSAGVANGYGVAVADAVAFVGGIANGLGIAIGDPAAMAETSATASGYAVVAGVGATRSAATGIAIGMSSATSIIPLGVYLVYMGDSLGGPIDYSVVVATTEELSIAMPALPFDSRTWFGVRKHDMIHNLTDQNTDCQIRIDVGLAGEDVTNVPLEPGGLRVRAGTDGRAAIEWTYRFIGRTRQPTGFHIYQGAPGLVDYGTPIGAVAYSGRSIGYLFTATGLADGDSYSFGVRAYNAYGEELNTTYVTVMADATPPTDVQQLTASLV